MWFKELESYKRIDTMCTLLNMCLPFELRFLGTCLEELGRRDAQDLRGVELRVNNQQEFVNDIQDCYSGELTDIKIRRKMALYLALLRASLNRQCINDLFKALDQWGDRDYSKFADGDPLQELLLVYTMATNHPIFTFEQRLRCGEILTAIKQSKQVDARHSPQQQVPQHMQATQYPPPNAGVATAGGYHQTIPPNYPTLHTVNASSTPPPPTNAAQTLPPNTFQMVTHYPASPMSQVSPLSNHLHILFVSTILSSSYCTHFFLLLSN